MRKRTQAMINVVEEAGKCELCGSKRSLEAHHCIPVVCGGDDSPENLICVCRACHVKLTPHQLLIKFGMKKTDEKTKYKLELYELIQKKLDNVEGSQMFPGDYNSLVFDAIDEL